MIRRTLVLVGGLALAVAIVLSVPARAQGQKPAGDQSFRTPWGDPDIQGLFTTDDELGVPFERPEQFGDRAVVTEEEFASRQTQAVRQAEADAEEFVAPRTGGRGGDGTGPPGHWLERGKPSRRTSVVIAPRMAASRISMTKHASARRLRSTRGRLAIVRSTGRRRWISTTDASRADCLT